MNVRVSVILLLLAFAGALPASAQSRDERETMARRFFAVGRYAEALDVYSKLYAETAHPTYMRNIGRCFQNLGEPDKAIASFRAYLSEARELTPDQRTQVEGFIREMEQLKQRRAVPVPEPPQGQAVTASPSPPVEVVTERAPAEPDSSGSGRRTGALVAGGAAIVAVGFGTGFGLRAISKRKESDPLCPADRCNDRGYALNQQAHTSALIADVAFGAGLVAAGAAAYLFLTSGHAAAGSTARDVQVRPALGPTGIGLTVGASW
jgi:tetratricopeptide (TPR) repeat protein